jgi:hypothetical protein
MKSTNYNALRYGVFYDLPQVTPFHTKIFSSARYSQTRSFNVRGLISHPSKTTSKVIVLSVCILLNRIYRNSTNQNHISHKFLCRFHYYTSETVKSRGRAVGIATGYGLETKGLEFESCKSIKISLPISSRPALGSTQPRIQWVQRTFSRE